MLREKPRRFVQGYDVNDHLIDFIMRKIEGGEVKCFHYINSTYELFAK